MPEEAGNNTGTAVSIPEKTVENRTASRIGITNKKEEGGMFVIPPFGKRKIPSDKLDGLEYEPWQQANLIRVLSGEAEGKESTDTKTAILTGCLPMLIVTAVVAGLVVNAFRGNLVYWGIIALVTMVILVVFIREIRQWLQQSLSLVLVLVIALGLPGFVIYFFGNVRLEGFQDLLLAPTSDVASFDLITLHLLGRVLQFIFIAILSALPAMLYFLFERQKQKTLRDAFFKDIMVLNPSLLTLDEAEGAYQRRVDETYGNGKEFRESTWSPLFVATVVITVCWIIALQPVGAALPPSPKTFLDIMLLPSQTPATFGFLGAYFFALNMVIRRYTRADLKPKAYSHITIRIITVIILTWTLSELFPSYAANIGELSTGKDGPTGFSPVLLVLSFFVGIFPETGFALIQEFLRSQKAFGWLIPSLQEKHPLNMLEGISLYDRARLSEEGIENIENLVHSDLIDLILQTRIPLSVLVDWIDQGILYIHVVESAGPKSSSPGKTEEESELSMTSLQTLRKYGIRTATDLEQVYCSACKRDKLDEVFNILPKTSEHAPSPLQSILDALKDDEWLSYIRRWRCSTAISNEVVMLPELFHTSPRCEKGLIQPKCPKPAPFPPTTSPGDVPCDTK